MTMFGSKACASRSRLPSSLLVRRRCQPANGAARSCRAAAFAVSVTLASAALRRVAGQGTAGGS